MTHLNLSEIIVGIAYKRLSEVEINPDRSNQHEFNGAAGLRQLFGTYRITDPSAKFIWVGGESDTFIVESQITWYDARERHESRTEYRLYFRENAVIKRASPGDLLIVLRLITGVHYLLILPEGSTTEAQLLWLFGIENDDIGFNFENPTQLRLTLDYSSLFILEELGIEIPDTRPDESDIVLETFPNGFPSTSEFSQFARDVAGEVPLQEDPDETLITWLSQEEHLFRRLERHLVGARIQSGFIVNTHADVDGFIQFSLSVQNRRKSRVGYALEHHLKTIFEYHQLRFVQQQRTDNHSRPDFLFPGIEEYNNLEFPLEGLTMLGVKSSCKDRWRQVLSEAARIENKHLFTLEPSISLAQTSEMSSHGLTLVIPESVHDTYKPSQRSSLLKLIDFIQLVQSKSTTY